MNISTRWQWHCSFTRVHMQFTDKTQYKMMRPYCIRFYLISICFRFFYSSNFAQLVTINFHCKNCAHVLCSRETEKHKILQLKCSASRWLISHSYVTRIVTWHSMQQYSILMRNFQLIAKAGLYQFTILPVSHRCCQCMSMAEVMWCDKTKFIQINPMKNMVILLLSLIIIIYRTMIEMFNPWMKTTNLDFITKM